MRAPPSTRQLTRDILLINSLELGAVIGMAMTCCWVFYIYKLGYGKRGSTAFKVQKDGCDVPSVVRTLLGPKGLLMR